MRELTIALFVLLLGTAVACSSSDDSTRTGQTAAGGSGGGGGAAGSGASAGGAGGAGSAGGAGASCAGVCVGTANTAPAVHHECQTGETPSATTGGAIIDGTYFLTKVVRYDPNCSPSDTERETLVVSGGGACIEAVSSGFDMGVSIASSGTTLTTTVACGGGEGEQQSGGYDATATTFVTYAPQAGVVMTFTKQ